jgi:hypothetical protein
MVYRCKNRCKHNGVCSNCQGPTRIKAKGKGISLTSKQIIRQDYVIQK